MNLLSALRLGLAATVLIVAGPAKVSVQSAGSPGGLKTREYFAGKEREATARYQQSLNAAIGAAKKWKAARSAGEREQARKEKSAADARAKADRVRLHAISGARTYPDSCSSSVHEAARRQGRTDFPNWQANDLVGFLDRRWKVVDARTAQARANRGEFGVAGFKQFPSGHVAVIVAGPGSTKRDGRFYPSVAGGARNPVARSAGEASAGDVWSAQVRAQVKYYFP